MNDPEIIEKLEEIRRELSGINREIKMEFTAIRWAVAIVGVFISVAVVIAWIRDFLD